VGSLEQQVMPAARRFPGLGLRVNRELELIEPVDTLTRVPRIAAPGGPAPGEASPGEPSPGESRSAPHAGRSADT
jgi:hypothetical protein